MKIQSIYPPVYINNVLDTSLLKALHETDETGGALRELNAGKDLMQTPIQYLEPDQGLARRSVMSYDMYGGLRDDGSNTSGTRVDIYA
jgi:hypothetical protein